MTQAFVVIDDDTVRSLLTPGLAMKIVRDAFVSAAEGTSRNFPVVRERLPHAVFGIKSAVDEQSRLLGLKAGGAFPMGGAAGYAHQSSVLLFDFERGVPAALVAGNTITRMRTAAAAALSVDLMARPDARVLGLIGAGAQAEAHLRAVLAIRTFEEVFIWSRNGARAAALAERVSDLARCRTDLAPADFVSRCDVLVTLTPAERPIIESGWVREGAHLACMGADTNGKQEIAADLLPRCRIVTDDMAQSIAIGECQAAYRLGLITDKNVSGTVGDILLGRIPGRLRHEEITLFDGTGVALQDLLAAACILDIVRSASGRN